MDSARTPDGVYVDDKPKPEQYPSTHEEGESVQPTKPDRLDETPKEDSDPTNTPKQETSLEEVPNGGEKTSGPTQDGPSKAPSDKRVKCEMKYLDRRYNGKNEIYFAETQAGKKTPTQKGWWRTFAFCVVKVYEKEGKKFHGRLYVNDQPLRQLLKDVIGAYPSDPIDITDVQIRAPYHALFHYRQQLKDEGFQRFETDEDSLAKLKLLLSWIDETFEDDITAYEKCVTRGLKSITYDHLWTLFPPRAPVYQKASDSDSAFRVTTYFYKVGLEAGFYLSAQYIDFDGEELGTQIEVFKFAPYEYNVDLAKLEVMPLSLVENADEVRRALAKRGRKFEAHIGQHFVHYDGNALHWDRRESAYVRFYVSGRVMIDCKTYIKYNASETFITRPLPNKDGKNYCLSKDTNSKDVPGPNVTIDALSEDDTIHTHALVRGYSFTLKKFLKFYVDNLSPIEWNTGCFDELVIEPSVKNLLQAYVSAHTSKRSNFEDIVKGKGQGLVCLLHGPPGVGKTLTAECVAESLRRPLYMVSSGDLGVASADVDNKLTKITELTATWGAVLLIDEADVFLEKRQVSDVHRNAMVSVCLRVLEYHTGILFLTTNRVKTFDEAFTSRIHIPIRYTNLTGESRKNIWRAFCEKLKSSSGGDDGGAAGVSVSEADLEVLAKEDFNGRQIKNIMRGAENLAISRGMELDLATIQEVVKIQIAFKKDLDSFSDIDYTALGETRKDIEAQQMYS